MHRAYHAFPGFRTSKGEYTGAIFGFLRLFSKLVKEQKPTHVAAAFDLKAPTFRHLMFDGYKATRKPMDEELGVQVEPLKDLLRLMGVSVVSKEGYEADDILGTLAKRFKDKTVIVTGDRDSFQLVSDSTTVFWTRKGVTDIVEVTPQSLAEDGFTVETFIDYKALRGDPSDNIPGVKGVGEKTARELLNAYGSLEGVLSHANEIKGKIGETVAQSREIARLSRELAVINCDVPVPVQLDDIAFTPVYSSAVKARLGELEFSSLIPSMQFEEGGENTAFEKEICVLGSVEDIVKTLDGADSVALLIQDKILFSTDGKIEYEINCGEDLFAELTFDGALEAVLGSLKNKRVIVYDFKSLTKKYPLECREFFDLMIAAHLARESAPIKNLDAVLGAEGVGAAEMFAASETLEEELHKKELYDLFLNVEQPLAVVLGKMEDRGFCVDSSKLKALETKYTELLAGLSTRIFEEVGCQFNIASPKQLGEILFERLGLKHGKKTKSGFSVNEDVLSSLVDSHPCISIILEWRHFSKLLSTYVIGMQPLVNRGRIHTEFKQCITTTGRLSSTNPNLQNIPVRSEEAKDIKSAFVASEGNILVAADYSQIELRLLAHFSKDEKLIEAYNRADDIHSLTASQILGISTDMVTPAQRRDAKAVNFGIIYGMSDFGLAENLAIPKYKAKEFIERYFETYPTVKQYLESNVQSARDCGYAVTLLGRRRNLSDITAQNYLVRSAAERMAKNTPLQGSAADIVKLAMIKVEKRLSSMKSKMILQIHDELIIDTAIDEKAEVERILKEEMEGVVTLEVPLVVETKSGYNWGEV